MKKTYLLLLCVITFYFSGLAQATTFSSEDFVGNWRGYFMETTSSNTTRLLRSARVEVSPTDYVVSGIWDDKGYSNANLGNGNITGGSLNITAIGEITGSINIKDSITLVENTITIVNGWMDIEKNIFYIVTKKPGGQLSTGLLAKYQHSFNGFATSDLEGIWFVNNIQSSGNPEGQDDGEWVVNILSVASDGSCIGNWYSSGNSSGTIDAGSSLELDSSYGWITGRLISGSSLIDLEIGQMSFDKNTATAIATIDAQDPSGGKLTSGVFLRAGGSSFINQDLKGTWAVYLTEVYSETNMYWLYGEITLDQSGNLVNGNWNGPNGQAGIFTEGQMTITEAGSLAGSLTTSTGYTSTIKKGLLSLSKNHASFAMEYGIDGQSGHLQDSVFMIRKSDNINIIPIMNLLLNQ